MRIVFMGFNRQYVNRTFSIQLRAIRANNSLDLFGPGFQPEAVVARGPDRWMDKHGPYDLVLFDSYLLEHDAIVKRVKPFAGDCLNMQPQDFYKYGPALQAFVLRYPGRKIFISNFDIYAAPADRLQILEDCGAYVCDGALPRFSLEEKAQVFGTEINNRGDTRGFIGGSGTDNWLTFVRAVRHRVLEVPHCIGLDQTSFVPLTQRRVQFVVPGTSYVERQRLYSLLTPRQRARQFVDRVSAKLQGFRSSLTSDRMRRLHFRYDLAIANSRVAFTSGSVFRSPVRKYFEIPALGTLPIGHVVEGFEDIGFIDGINFIIAERLDDVKRALSTLVEDGAQAIASRAQQLVIEKHSEPARAKQLADSFSRIVNGTFRGGYWSKGEYCHF